MCNYHFLEYEFCNKCSVFDCYLFVFSSIHNEHICLFFIRFFCKIQILGYGIPKMIIKKSLLSFHNTKHNCIIKYNPFLLIILS